MRIVSLNGLLGYGYTEEGLNRAMATNVDYVGVDGGSTDPGPFYLGYGKSFTDYKAVKRDIELSLPLALRQKAPFIIGTAGGSGADIHVDWLIGIFNKIAEEQNLSFNMAILRTEISKEYVKEKLKSGKVISLGDGLELTEQIVDQCVRIVSQVGVEPYLKVLKEHPEIDVLIAGRSCDTAIYAAPAILHGMDPGLAFHMGKIMECGTMCSEPLTGADVLIADIEKKSFTLEPANPIRRCTIKRVAAHTMYEQSSPFVIHEPSGVIDMHETKYEQVSDRAVRVSNSVFMENEKKTLKIEGVKKAGYRAIAIGAINDPETIRHIDELFQDVKDFLAENMSGRYKEDDYTIILRKYGECLPGCVMLDKMPNHNLGVIIDVVAKTQEIANTILALARAKLLHADYLGRKCSAGNIAFSYSPSDIVCGEVYTFAIYHLVEVDDLCETTRFEFVKVGENK